MKKGILFVLSGPAGSGKGTVVECLLKKHPEIKLSISKTTRAPRGNEIPNVNYYYVTKEDFQKSIENNEFFEYAQYSKNYYGTPNSEVVDYLERGIDVILEIEVVGAMKVKAMHPETVTIMLTPPDSADLERRLRGRASDSEEQILMRLARAKEEIKSLPDYDYSVVNEFGKQEECADLIYAIMQASHRKTSLTKSIIENFIK